MALGRGLDSILGDVEQAYNKELHKELVADIEIDRIEPNPFQPRRNFSDESLRELSQSIERHGLIQPIIVIRKGDNFTLIAGERRLRATKLLGEDKIKAIVANIGDKNLRELALIENIQRENLSPIELANAYQELINEYKITQEALASIVKKSRTQITNTLRLLGLDEHTKELIDEGKITQGHAKIMVGLNKDNQKLVADSIMGQKLSVRDTENLVKRLKNSNQSRPRIDFEDRKNLNLLKDLIEELGIKCKINGQKITLNLNDSKKIDNMIKIIQKIQ
ncbi:MULTISPECIES: ParB/RepB/Spo0J family partition protein [Campylobacter]|jgi:ParB family chromosome partitioning protein|uniref:Chromosome partitioning protein n=1 Tax=Campylobacter devanensis TaxID=3161138 RepID=A0A1X9STK0_9BACT|nr:MULTISPECIES: ParB/RepB/Spo0J family partition protein [Campylobacter]MEE3694490.1 ParB/RepB/Spo0J family partition protein [Campylobacter sp. CLAX-22107-21]MEE3712592.1 ParB/RepB/Spo0J family partition protein [Campylobacter sp. CLAX-7218-21]ARQ99604.1 chromosome partitioning protein [Campylobacter lanienae]MBO7155372.1 ParB/RepB/Spo0J family partition protein [Campylobacter sp.]MBR2149126.1 ParB/RepB/Spo0J family partition protein [Campylobacter sp.]